MSPNSAQSRAPTAPPSPGLGSRCAAGAVCTVLCTLAGRVVTLLGNVAIAYFLLPEELGLAALAFSVISVSTFFSANSLRNVLIQQSGTFAKNLTDVFWLSIILHTAASLALLLLAPVAASISQQPGIVPLIAIHALSCPVGAIATVYTAVLLRDLRYETVAGIGLADAFINSGAATVLAACGCGAYSLIIPMLLRVTVLAAVARLAAGRVAITRPQPRRWPALLLPSLWLMLNVMFTAVYYYGASFAIGLICDTAVIGIFFWGFQASSHLLMFLSNNVKDVLFPALLRLNDDPGRQHLAYVKASRALAILVVPMCMLQAVIAAPVVELLFPARWQASIPVVVIISLGMVSQPPAVMAASLLMSRGRFRLIALAAGGQTAAVMMGAAAGAMSGDAAYIAAVVAVCISLGNLAVGRLGVGQFAKGWVELFRTIAAPAALAAAAAFVSWQFGAAAATYGSLCRIAASLAVMISIYSAMVWYFLPGDAAGLLSYIYPIINRGNKATKNSDFATPIPVAGLQHNNS